MLPYSEQAGTFARGLSPWVPLHLGRVLERFPEIAARLEGMLDRFTSVRDCVDVAFLPSQTLDELPRPAQLGATRVGGIDLNKAPVAELTEKVQQMTGRPASRSALDAYFALGHGPGGSRVWWRRWHNGSDVDLATRT